jgi:hypothetical protein
MSQRGVGLLAEHDELAASGSGVDGHNPLPVRLQVLGNGVQRTPGVVAQADHGPGK